MTNNKSVLPDIRKCYGTLPSMLKKFDRLARQNYFKGKTKDEFSAWKSEMLLLLSNLLGLDKMEQCDLTPVIDESVVLPNNIRREHIRIQTEPDVWMTMYLLIPENSDPETEIFICPPGHGAAGKYSVAGAYEYDAVHEKILSYHYDYGMWMARQGYVAVCPDCRGFGERREDPAETRDPILALKGDCYWLSHMGEPLGIPAAGMFTWDLMRLIDYLYARGEWNLQNLGCMGFSGGGMQTLFLSVFDGRVKRAVISGYLYGYRDALLALNRNCSCNYIPHLWEYLDMGDIASLIAPRPLIIQSCRDDRLNGPRGIRNVCEQVEIVRKAYELFNAEQNLIHDICDGGHQWHGEHMAEYLKLFEYKRKQELFHGQK